MTKLNSKAVSSFKNSLIFSALLLLAPMTTYAATTTPTPDYNKPVCEGIGEEDGDACIAKLNQFCSIAGNELYTDCKEWKTIQDDVNSSANNDPNTTEDNSSGTSGGGSSSGGMSQALMFSPSAFASQQAIGLITEIFTCKNAMSEEEKALPNRLGANLCIYVGEYCSKTVKILGVKLCRTKKKAYCCYNSTLARIINTEGNKQLGRGMGGPKDATCQGFTIDEFSKIDLSKMDLSEFVAEVTAKANATSSKNQAYWSERNSTRMENTWKNVNTEDMKYQILTADDPYSVVSQPTDGKTSAQSEGRVVGAENQWNTPTAKETGKNAVNQNDLNEAKENFKNGTN